MPNSIINGADIFWEQTSDQGEPMILVHGSWGDHHGWGFITPHLSNSYRVISYDRRGHSQSLATPLPDQIDDDVSDLEALIEMTAQGQAHVVASSFGGVIALKLAIKRPDLFKSLIFHEPPLFGVVQNPLEDMLLGDALQKMQESVAYLKQDETVKGIKVFFELVAGPDMWDSMGEEDHQYFIAQADTFLGENMEPDWYKIDITKLVDFPAPTLLTKGDQSPEFLIYIADRLVTEWPNVKFQTIEGADHVPHMTHAEIYAELIKQFLQ